MAGSGGGIVLGGDLSQTGWVARYGLLVRTKPRRILRLTSSLRTGRHRGVP